MTRGGNARRWQAGAAVGLACALSSLSARAHTIGLSSGEYRADGSDLAVVLSFARSDLAALVPSLDADRDGHVTALEVERARPALSARVIEAIEVTQGGRLCASSLRTAELTDQDGLTLTARFACGADDRPFEVSFGLASRLPAAHRHVSRAVGKDTVDQVLSREEPSFQVLPREARGARSDGATRSFFAMGVEHILTGYDHLVFLLGLVLVRARLRRLLAIVTSFTVAHSVSLALATFGVLEPGARVIEPSIALSIAYVGLENLRILRAPSAVAERHDAWRWKLTFLFGLVHGFGFAGALRELGLPRARLPWALATFNVGVEVGQLAVLSCALACLLFVRDRAWFQRFGALGASAAVAIAGLAWFFERVVSP